MPVASILTNQPPKSAEWIFLSCSRSTSGRPSPRVLNALPSYPHLLSWVCLLCLPGHRRPILICAAAGPLPDLSSPCGYFFWYSLVDTGRPMCLRQKCTAALLVVAQAAMWDLLLPMDKKIRATCAIFVILENALPDATPPASCHMAACRAVR